MIQSIKTIINNSLPIKLLFQGMKLNSLDWILILDILKKKAKQVVESRILKLLFMDQTSQGFGF